MQFKPKVHIVMEMKVNLSLTELITLKQYAVDI